MFAIFAIYSSFSFLLVGVCIGLGAVLDARTAFVTTWILPSLFAIFGQGTTNQIFTDSYPGGNGQVISGLMIDDVDKNEWTIFAISIVVNILIGSIGFHVFMVKMGNYNPFSKLFSKHKEIKVNHEKVEDEENFARRNGGDILLEGKAIEKIYGVGEEDSVSFKALDNVTFAVEKGSLLGLVGKSGAGVSFLVYCILVYSI